MSKDISTKQAVYILIGVALVASIGAYIYVTFSSSSDDKSPRVPDGYYKTSSKENENEIVHKFEKTPPKKVKPVQTSEQTFARYLDALPEAEKIVGVEFKSLFKSRQNAQLYADYTGLMARAKENTSNIVKSDAEMKEINTKDSVSNIDDIETFSAGPDARLNPTKNNDDISAGMKVDLMDSIKLNGTFQRSGLGDVQYGALISTFKGSKRVIKGDYLSEDIVVVNVTSNKLVVKNNGELRTFRLDGSI